MIQVNQAPNTNTANLGQWADLRSLFTTNNASASPDYGVLNQPQKPQSSIWSAFQPLAERATRLPYLPLTQPMPKTTSTDSMNIFMALKAYQILGSSSSGGDKAKALAGIGIQAGFENGILNADQSSALGGLLNVSSSIENWNDLDDIQRINTISNGLGSLGSLSTSFGGSSAQLATLGSGLSAAASGIGAGLGLIQSVDQGVDIAEIVNDLPRSQAVGVGAQGLGITGASIGLGLTSVASMAGLGASIGSGFPVVGTAIGAAVGALAGIAVGMTGSGKNTGQKMRDAWRDSMEQMGLANKIDGSHHVALADGTTYDIGKDGGHKLANVGENIDGKIERFTFDVDWSNPLSADSVPLAHIFAMATGLNPQDSSAHGLFDRAVGQSLNAANSNATSIEDVRKNFRAMLGEIQPQEIATRLLQLAEAQKISEQELTVYIHHLEQMYTTE